MHLDRVKILKGRCTVIIRKKRLFLLKLCKMFSRIIQSFLWKWSISAIWPWFSFSKTTSANRIWLYLFPYVTIAAHLFLVTTIPHSPTLVLLSSLFPDSKWVFTFFIHYVTLKNNFHWSRYGSVCSYTQISRSRSVFEASLL